MLLEEESFSWYTPDTFCPIKIGDILQSKYQVLGKLGYGSVSTAWLCRDLVHHKYFTLKAYVSIHRQARNEFKVLDYISHVPAGKPGSNLVRKMRDTFQVPGKKGPHQCLIHEPLGLTASQLQDMSGGKVPMPMLKAMIGYLLLVLDFLHSDAHVVHTDIQGGNLMLGLKDDSILRDFEEEEWEEPSARKFDGDYVIYASRALEIPDDAGPFILCDFGDAHHGDNEHMGEVMPDLYRAPEIVLGIPWKEKIDIWSTGLMIWDLFEGKRLFTERLPSREESEAAHLARMVALLGPPPLDLVKRGSKSWRYFDENGNFIAKTQIPKGSLEDEEENLSGEDQRLFLEFLRKMLQWRPQDRKSASELLQDRWLMQEQ